MKKQQLVIFGIAAILASLAFASFALAVEQTKCPVMGGDINKSLYADVEGKRVYVCCEGCISKVEADPKTYIAKLENAGVTLEKVQTKCPVMGGDIDKSLYVDANGKRIYVCCEGCIDKVNADPGKYIGQLEKEGITLATATKAQETCPVMGGKINKDLYVDANGKRIYVCCGGCIDTVKADPAKYIKVLEERGETVETIGR